MPSWNTSVSPKGQITLPVEVRRKLELKPKDIVTVTMDGDEVRVTSPLARLRAVRAKYPPAHLPHPMTWHEIVDAAHEEVARNGWEELHGPDEP